MAREIPILLETFDLLVSTTAKQYYVAKMSTTADHVALTTAKGEKAIGIVQDKSSSGGSVGVMILGISKAAHDGTCTPGGLVGGSTGGLATTASTAGAHHFGICLNADSTASGSLITMFVCPTFTS